MSDHADPPHSSGSGGERPILATVSFKGGVGKCVDGDTLVTDPDTGLQRHIRDIVATSDTSTVAAIRRDTGMISVEPITARINSGRQRCLRVTLASGRSITVTPTHPLLLPDGWRQASAISAGETIAVPARLPHPQNPQPLPAGELDLLAVILAEGACTGGGVSFSTADPSILELVQHAAAREHMSLTPKGRYRYQLVGHLARDSHVSSPVCRCGCAQPSADAVVSRRRRSHVRGEPLGIAAGHGRRRSLAGALARRHGVLGVLSKHKRIPPAVFRLPADQLARFLAVTWMCDGYVDDRGPGITLASEPFVRAIQHLLLRFGVQSSVHPRSASSMGKRFPAWRLLVRGHSRRRFHEAIPLWGTKASRLAAFTERGPGNPNTGEPSFPKTLQVELREAIPALRFHACAATADRPRWQAGDQSLSAVARRLGWRQLQFTTLSNWRTSTLSRQPLRALCEVYDLQDRYGWLWSSDIHWDRVVDVRNVGERDVYDLEVASTQSFIGDDVVLHNSTLAVHLASTMGAVLVDFEPWGSATTWWAGAHTQRIWRAPGAAPILRALEKGTAPRTRRGAANRPDIVPSHEQLLRLTDGADGGVASWAWDSNTAQPAVLVKTAQGPRRVDDALADALPQWAASWEAPAVVVDTPGGFSPLADAALAAADCVIVPFTLDPWSFPALSKFLAMYAPRVRSGLVVPNRVRDRAREDPYVAVLQEPGFIPHPFVLGPPVSESDVLRFSERPLTAGVDPGRARRDAIAQIDAVADRARELARAAHASTESRR